MRACISFLLVALVVVSSQAQLVPLWRKINLLPDGGRFTVEDHLFAEDGSAYFTVWNLSGRAEDGGFKLLKRSPLGDIEWYWRFPKIPYAYGTHLVRDRDGNLIVSGYYWDGRIQRGALVAKFSPTGVLQWLRRIYYPPGIIQAFGDVVGTDSSNNVYVTLYLAGTGNPLGLAKISPSGEVLWTQGYPSTYELVDAHAMFTDDAGNSTIVARAQSYPQPSDIVIVKYSTDGALLWSQIYSGREGGSDGLPAEWNIKRDSRGDLYLVVISSPSSRSWLGSVALLKYSPEGELLWESRPSELQANNERTSSAGHLILDEERNRLYFGAGISGIERSVVVCCSLETGDVVWLREIEPVNAAYVGGFGIVADRWGRVYAAFGDKEWGGADWRFLGTYVAQLSQAGEVNWVLPTGDYSIWPLRLTDAWLQIHHFNSVTGYGVGEYAILAAQSEGDVTGDGTVDDEDLTLIIDRFGGSDPAADVNGDGIVYKEDLAIAATYYGLGYDMNEGRGAGMARR